MKNPYSIICVFSFLFLLIACSSTFKVVTNPEQATVYWVDPKTGNKQKLGETPLEKKDSEIKEAFGSMGEAGSTVQIVVEKEGFHETNLLVPVTASGTLATEIRLELKTDETRTIELKTASAILDQMFLAQKFALESQFERALIEIDKILEAYPDFARALSMKASIYYASGNFGESLKFYEKALEVDPKLTQAVEMSSKVRQQLRLPAASAGRGVQ